MGHRTGFRSGRTEPFPPDTDEGNEKPAVCAVLLYGKLKIPEQGKIRDV